MTRQDYHKQATDFLEKTNTTFEAKWIELSKHFDGDETERDIYWITLTRGSRSYSFRFGQSIKKSLTVDKIPWEQRQNVHMVKRWMDANASKRIAPTAYDVLACLTKYDPGTLENFCLDWGYDIDSKKAEKTYLAVKDEFLQLSRLFSDDELTELSEIN
jgi:hypothetical protein